jgi:hypothetical protein
MERRDSLGYKGCKKRFIYRIKENIDCDWDTNRDGGVCNQESDMVLKKIRSPI